MNSNSKLLSSIFGCLILASLNNPLFEKARFGILENANGITIVMIYQIYNLIINILSFTGFVLLVVFSIKLIIKNIVKDK
jgi:hypothetical protein